MTELHSASPSFMNALVYWSAFVKREKESERDRDIKFSPPNNNVSTKDLSLGKNEIIIKKYIY